MAKKADIKADIKGDMEVGAKPQSQTAVDRGESIDLMEPLILSEGSRHRSLLNDLALELAQKSAGLRRSMPASLTSSLADLVRSMNCYYSNLIEGHDTHPVDIERALKKDFSADPHQRDLQLEAKAHIAVQAWIDEGGLAGRAFTAGGLCETHRRFCELLPPDLLWVEDPMTKERIEVVPGEIRHRDVQIGGHLAISPAAVPRFLSRFESVHDGLGKTDTIVAAAAAHHRLVWIHPFLDGNGRVARLMSHATLLEALDTGGLWSIARGLARSVGDYRRHLAACDQTRRSDLDGRGNLSEEALADFTAYFLRACIDQVSFMDSLMRPDQLRSRIRRWAEEETDLGRLPLQARAVLDEVLYRGGELARAEVATIVGRERRQARRVVSALVKQEVLVATSDRAPLRLAFPARLASRWMPGLFPEQSPH